MSEVASVQATEPTTEQHIHASFSAMGRVGEDYKFFIENGSQEGARAIINMITDIKAPDICIPIIVDEFNKIQQRKIDNAKN